MMKTQLLYLPCAVALLMTQNAWANDQNHGEGKSSEQMPHVVLNEMAVRLVVPSHVENLGRDNLKQSAAQNIDDIAMYEPGVGVRSDNMQLGHQNFNIRGMDGNRVLMTLDGVPLPDEQSDLSRGGGFAPVVSRDTVETDTVRSVQIVKGANGTAQGDGAVGGSVNMRTYSPLDLVSDDKPYHAGLKYGYRSTYKSHGATATLAAKRDMLSALLMLSHRKQHEAENYPTENDKATGDLRTESNDQSISQKNVLLKVHVDSDEHHLETTAEQFVRKVDTQRFDRHRSTTGQSRIINTRVHSDKVESAFDEYVRRRYGVDYHYTPTDGWFDKLSLRLYAQKLKSQTDSHSKDILTPLAGGSRTFVNIKSDGIYNQDIRGIRPELYKTLDLANARHNLLFGAEHRQTKTERLTEQMVIQTGKADQHNHGAYFPPAKRRLSSIYAQDNIAFNNGATLGLGLRYEMEKTTFDFENPHYQTSVEKRAERFNAMKNKTLLPSVGLTYPLAQNLTGSFAYRRGYRSPDVNYAGSGFSNSRFGYRVIPNPNLKPEASDNYELGLTFNDGKLKANATAFYSNYKDFISGYTQTQNVPAPFRMQIYYDNIAKARAYGAEVKASYQINDYLGVSGAAAWIDTKNKTADQPLSTAYPINGVLGVDYKQEQWDVGAKMRWAKKNNDVLLPVNGNSYFKAPGFAVFDVVASYRPVKNIELTAGVYNITDKKYWLSADTKGVLDNAQKDRYTQPGRNFAVGAEFKF
ncbi:MAG: TonB-dependent hemoglobin/transferrin/lactoferrin family receptor [Moraxella sp.]|nr:TonB-dependent hemoglobin/transferrin/lactoferrin family receptor [Moraxella sp.]